MEPWGTYPEDLRAAQVACTIANVNRGKKQRAFSTGDFIPKWKARSTADIRRANAAKKKNAQTGEDHKTIMLKLMAGLGIKKTVYKKKKPNPKPKRD